jgi:hypothetical protein
VSTEPAVDRRPRRIVPTAADVAALRDEVARFERQFGTTSEAMFDADPPKASELEETEDLHAWHFAWCHLQALTGQ